MVGHEYPGMNMDTVTIRRHRKPVRVSPNILVAAKAGLTIIAALNDMLRKAGWAKTS